MSNFEVDRIRQVSKLLFGTRLRLPVAALIASSATGLVHARQIAAALGVNDNQALAELRSLELAGLLCRWPRKAGERVVWYERMPSEFWTAVTGLMAEFGGDQQSWRAPDRAERASPRNHASDVVDIVTTGPDGSTVIVETKSTDWNAVSAVNRRRNARRHAEQLLSYMDAGNDRGPVVAAIVYRQKPSRPGLAEEVEALLGEHGVAVVWAGEGNQSRGEESADIGIYCVRDQCIVEVVGPREVVLRNGRLATRGTCPRCGTTLFKVGALPDHAFTSARTTIVRRR